MNGRQHALYPVLTQLCAGTRPDGLAPMVAVTSARSGSGTSYVARTLALLAAEYYGPHGHRVALVDLDLTQQSQGAYFNSPSAQHMHGSVHGPYDATFGIKPYWQVSPDALHPDGTRQSDGFFCSLHLVADTGLAFTEFQWPQIKNGQSVHVVDAPEYWRKIREHFALVIVDTPAFDRLDTALTAIPEADKTAIVSLSERGDNPENKDLAARIVAQGGICAGMILNGGVNVDSALGRPENG